MILSKCFTKLIKEFIVLTVLEMAYFREDDKLSPSKETLHYFNTFRSAATIFHRLQNIIIKECERRST